ncbi:spore cortex biosynthesis protein YabQ [Oceanobacillus sp. CAU 1775]
MSLSVQFATIIAMVLSGVYLGIIQSTFQRFSVYWKKRNILKYVLEISFWVLQTVIIFYILFRVNAGELRLYVFLACLLGFSFYQALLKGYYLRLLEVLIRIGKKVLFIIERILYVLIFKPIQLLAVLVISIVVLIGKICFYPFLFLGKFIYSTLPIKNMKISHKFKSFYSTIKSTFRK